MTLPVRLRWLVAWLGLACALALPLASWARSEQHAKADDLQADEASASDEAEEADEPDEPSKPEKSDEPDKHKSNKSKEKEEEETGVIDWSLTHHGLYLAAEGSYNFLTQKSDIEQSALDAGDLPDSVNSKTNDSWGYGGRLGWRLMDRIGVEGQFAMLNDIEIKQHLSGQGSDAKAQFLTATANVKGYLLTQRFQPYGLFGAGYGHSLIDPADSTSDRSDGFVMRFGTGFDYYFTDALGATSEVAYVLPTGDISDFDYVALHFGFFLRFYGD